MLDRITDYEKKRIKSWLKKARSKNINFFDKMIFFWISFNSYYSKRMNCKNEYFESRKIRNVFSQLRGFGENDAQRFIVDNNQFINNMIKSMTKRRYIDQIRIFRRYSNSSNYKSAFIELLILISKVRNRLFHGGKTYENPDYGNRQVLTNCNIILDNVMKELERMGEI